MSKSIAELGISRDRLHNQISAATRAGLANGSISVQGDTVTALNEAGAGVVENLGRLYKGADRLDEQITEARRENVREAAQRPGAVIAGGETSADYWDRIGGGWSGQRKALPDPSAAQASAMAAIVHANREGELPTADADRLSDLITGDLRGIDASYIAAVASPAYERAFAQALVHGPQASFRMDQAEADAMRTALAAHSHRASFGGMGGFSAGPIGESGGALPLPLSVDPSIQITNAGAVSPLRQLADVRTITTQSFKLGTSAGMVASWDPEFTEVSDDTPTIVADTITPQKAQAFATWSIEVDQDWTAVRANLSEMLADSKARLESAAFLTGAGEGSDQPQGILTGGTVTVTSSTVTISPLDLIAAQDALDARYQPNAVWVSNLSTRNTIDQLVAAASTTAAPIVNGDQILRRPWYEASDMASLGSNALYAIYGDIKQAYRIVDRIGLSVELVPVILGPSQRPTGQRGIYAYWRVSAAVTNPNAIRVLKRHA
jgi:HK97 family phage major capsid protein